MPLKAITLASFLALSAGGLSAHEVAKGPNGGKVVDVAGHHLEFVPSGSDVTIYATDETEKPIATTGAKARVIVQADGKTAQIQLTPVEPNKLVGKLEAPLSAGAVAVVSTTFADGHTAQARFIVD